MFYNLLIRGKILTNRRFYQHLRRLLDSFCCDLKKMKLSVNYLPKREQYISLLFNDKTLFYHYLNELQQDKYKHQNGGFYTKTLVNGKKNFLMSINLKKYHNLKRVDTITVKQ